jgi:hypothetical protein
MTSAPTERTVRIRFTPHEAQARIMASKARFRAVCCGRRWGKTRLAACLAMAHVRATEEPDSVVFWDFDQWTCLYRFAQQSREELAEYTRLIATTSLIVLDEFNRDFTAPQARGVLDLLKARFDRRQRLVVTCMFGLLECVETWDADPKLERWGSAIRRRLVDDAKMIPVCLDKEPK